MIRNFIYLDSEKLRSISSQLFEGVTEQIVRQASNTETEQETQKGPVNSGRLVADIFAKESSSSELKFLEDHAYTLLENELMKAEVVDEITSLSTKSNESKKFVKVTGTLSINDTFVTSATLKAFNTIGEAQWRSTNETGETLKPLGDTEARKKAREAGLQINQKWADSLSLLLDYGYDGILEFHIETTTLLFSAPIKRNFLRESERMLLHKYSRVTQTPFTILGIVTQRFDNKASETKIPNVGDVEGMKPAMRALSLNLRQLEQTYIGPTEGEIILDPIAIYSSI